MFAGASRPLQLSLVRGPEWVPCLGPPHRDRFHLVAKSTDLQRIVTMMSEWNCTQATKVELYRR